MECVDPNVVADEPGASNTLHGDLLVLKNMFVELDDSTIETTYLQCDRDMSTTMQALANMLKSAHASLHTPPAQAEAVSSVSITADATGDVVYNNNHDLDNETSESFTSGAWDMSALTVSFGHVGTSVQEGMTSLAANFSSWVSDIASAFDTSWQADEGGPGRSLSQMRDPLSASHGGNELSDNSSGTERTRSRRTQVCSSGTSGSFISPRTPSYTTPRIPADDSHLRTSLRATASADYAEAVEDEEDEKKDS